MTVPRRFRGPPDSGNGGWVSGTLAGHVRTTGEHPAVTVRLNAPPPLDRPLPVVGDSGELLAAGATLRLLDGDVLVATAASVAELDQPLPAPAPLEAARAAEQRFEGRHAHPFPTCFVCGTDREPGDGLRLAPGPLTDGTGRYATTWRAPQDVDRPMVWAALDCPGGWSAGVAGRPMVLGTMTARVWRVPTPGEELVVTAWPRGAEGRKHRSASSVHTSEGELLGRSVATWLAVDPTRVRPREQP
ncbi:hypothetical protein H9L10_00870 [Phycicoccus endophyticus]|uniref:Thioesterase family protein n=1 Tax=Phycicoccus endophyticus TaxID=1690220 RepID=A0A7G9R5G7_9MICO|nr:hypothetical protein [Phycicoccus endophyticus]QNN50842.1 hypothetical protein H9L10_00870 [Phycicoccus endophyticus]